jgi:hypothetical protein
MDVTGWFSAKARTGPGMVPVGANAGVKLGERHRAALAAHAHRLGLTRRKPATDGGHQAGD